MTTMALEETTHLWREARSARRAQRETVGELRQRLAAVLAQRETAPGAAEPGELERSGAIPARGYADVCRALRAAQARGGRR